MIIVGIDPGIAGAICFFSSGNVIDVIDMPTMAEGKKNKKQVNGRQIYNEIMLIKNKFKNEKMSVIVEQVSAMPGQGVTSMFNFGQSFGVIKGICYIFDERRESIRLIGPETDYTYRVPPAILRRRGRLRGLSRLWRLR